MSSVSFLWVDQTEAERFNYDIILEVFLHPPPVWSSYCVGGPSRLLRHKLIVEVVIQSFPFDLYEVSVWWRSGNRITNRCSWFSRLWIYTDSRSRFSPASEQRVIQTAAQTLTFNLKSGRFSSPVLCSSEGGDAAGLPLRSTGSDECRGLCFIHQRLWDFSPSPELPLGVWDEAFSSYLDQE